MIVSERHHFIFIKTRKTAGTSIQRVLATICGDSDVVTPLIEGSPGYTPRNYQGLFDPWPYLVGRYNMHSRKHTLRRLLRRQRIHSHIFLSELFDLPESAKWKDYFRFCVERNPWDKTVSHYFWKYRNQSQRPEFEEFVARSNLVSDFDMYSLDGRPSCDLFLKYEELPDALSAIENRIGVKLPMLPRSNSWTRREGDYRKMYTEASYQIVAAKFSREIGYFGYKF